MTGGADYFFGARQQPVDGIGQPQGGLFRAGFVQPNTTTVTANLFLGSADRGLLDALGAPTDEARSLFAPDGAWISSVQTDAEGRATVRLTLPAVDGGFRLTARGVTRATDVGDARAEIRTARDLVASIQAPAVLVAGDRTTVRTTLHNRAAEPVEVDVVRRVGADEARDRVTLAAGEEQVREFEHFAAAAGSPEAVVEAGAARTAIDLDVLPFGVERRVGRAGVVRDVAQFGVALPSDKAFSNLALRLELAVGGARGLVSAALASSVPTDNCSIGPNTLFDLTQRGLAAVAVLDQLDSTGADARGERSELEGRLSGIVAALVAAQDAAGGLPWGIGRKGAGPGAASPELRTTSASLRLFHAAAARGVAGADTAAEAAIRYLLERLRGLPDEQRIEPEHALAVTGRGRFENLFALHRRRAGLDLGSLGRLALAWRSLDRPALADEVDETIAPLLAKLGRVDARHVTDVAIAVQSLLLAGPSDPRIPPVLDWIESRRIGRAWATAEATAESVRALCLAGGADRAAAADGQLVIRVNGRELASLPLDRELPVVDVPSDLLGGGETRVELRLSGRGSVRYSAVLSGFSAGFDDSQRNFGRIRTGRNYRQPYLRLDGKVVQPGTSVVAEVMQTGENQLTQLVVGEPGRVDTHFMVDTETDPLGIGPIVVEEPIPAGCTVPESSIQGSFASYEVLPGRLRFYYAPGARGDLIRYELVGRFAGKYRALPTVVYGSGRPDILAYGPVSSLEVLPAGSESVDVYRMSPDERWAFGKAAYAAGELQRAGELLAPLATGLSLRSSIARELAEMMLLVAIDGSDARAIVRWFEELKDRAPDFVVPFDAIRAVGSAYSQLGEHELSVLVYRATAESSFLKEAQVARTLQELGEVQSSVRFLRRLLSTYPDLNSVRQSLYGIGQRLALLAAAQNPGARVDPRVGDRLELRRAAVETFREFLIQYPEDPLAEEVSFAWATTLIEGGQLDRALAVAEGALARYPDSPLEDEFLYTVGYARFVGGRAQEALDVVRRVATEEFVGVGGQKAPSQNRPHAIYLEGQILHAEGDVEDALQAYDTVSKDFTDAAEAAAYFRRRELGLPEVTRIDPDAPSTITVTSRNVSAVAVQAYRVDLMRLYLLRKSLDDVRGIQLHGIAPVFDTELVVDGAGDHAERRLEVALPFEGEGAYLVVARADELLATGLVLRSGLTIDAEENLGAGRVRVNVRRPGGLVGAAEVKVVGSADGQIRSGETDLRGIFVADDVVGRATVLVRVGEAFAFFRGEGVHQPSRMPQQDNQLRFQQMEQDAGPAQKDATRAFNAWENNLNLNLDNRARQSDWLEQQVLKNPQRGVQVQRAK
ncbi:MAG: alpha-2-macroglobulin family protein [Planctomycetota bacterium]